MFTDAMFHNRFRFIKGYMTRGQARNTENSEYLAFVRQNYLNRLKGNLPETVLDKTTWQSPPAVLAEVRRLIRVGARPVAFKRSFYLVSLCAPDIRAAAAASLPSDGAEVCARNHPPEKSPGT